MNQNQDKLNIYTDMTKHILLLFFTCGIYYFIWIYKIANYLNEVDRENYKDPMGATLLCMFVPFYLIFWSYNTAKRVEKLIGPQNGTSGDFATIILVLSIFISIAVPIIIQSKLNAFSLRNASPYGCAAGNYGPVNNYAPNNNPAANGNYAPNSNPIYGNYYPPNSNNVPPNNFSQPPVNSGVASSEKKIIEEIKAYKELLDMGAITKEDFEQKKKDILSKGDN